MDTLVLVERPADGVTVVTLNRPRKYNALTGALLAELAAACDAILADATVRAVVLTGADPAFCAGIDLGELGTSPEAFGTGTLRAVQELPVPVIAAVNGVAVTGGLELALACDFRIAGDRARFADTHARVGVVPGWGLTARLPAAVGQSWARQMSFTGNFVDAELALRIGLVNEVVPHAQLLERAVQLATDVTSTDPTTLARIRGIYRLGADGSGADALAAEQQASAEGLELADPEQFASRRAAVFARGRQQADTQGASHE
jgi:enoyl-CoA hydratase